MINNLRVIEGGLLPKEKCDKNFISAYVTNTRLMGAIGMCIHWEVLDSPDAENLYQFFYFDAEEFGFENYVSLWSDNEDELTAIEHSVISGLGGEKIQLTEREARAIFLQYYSFNRRNNLTFPEGRNEYSFLADTPMIISPEEESSILRKQFTPLTGEYQLINYFLMRCFGKDFLPAKLISKEGLPLDEYPELGMSTLCRNSIDENFDSYICESLVENNNEYWLLVSEIKIENMKISSYKRQSSFKVSLQEVAMMLSHSEFITVFEIIVEPETLDDKTLEFKFNTMITNYENGKLFLAFHENNDHVKKKVFHLSEDVFGMYYITDFGELIISAPTIDAIGILETEILSSNFGSYLIPTARYEFKEPILYDFMQSDYEEFDDFVTDIKGEE